VFDALNKYSNDPWWVDRSLGLLRESDPELQWNGVWILGDSTRMGEHLPEVREFWKRAPEWPVQKLTLEKLERLTTAEGRETFWGCAEDAVRSSGGKPTGIIADWEGVFIQPLRLGEENRYAALLRQALGSGFQESDRNPFSSVVGGVLNLPIPQALQLLEELQPSLRPVFSKAVAAVLEKVRAGETRKSVLVEVLRASYPALSER